MHSAYCANVRDKKGGANMLKRMPVLQKKTAFNDASRIVSQQ